MLQQWLDTTPWMPDLHSLPETVAFMRARLIAATRMWVAEADGAPRGYLALREDGCVLSITVAPGWRRRGVGAQLLDRAKAAHPGGLWLWCFVANAPALRFYARHGFRETARSDGDNDEGLPDIRLDWEAPR